MSVVGTISRRERSNKYHIYYLTKLQTASASKPISNQKIIIYYPREDNPEEEKGGSAEKKEFSPQVGNRIWVKGRLDLFETAVNPGMFDQRDYYRKRGIVACIWADSAEILEDECFWAGEILCKLPISWNHMLDEAIGEEKGELLSAMLFGEKNDLDPDVKEIYRLSGIGHILAISGLHMSFLGMGLYRLLRRTGLPFLPAGTAGGSFLSVYEKMIGGSASGIRALCMYLVRIGAEVAGRTYDMAISLAVASIVTVALHPLYLTDASFLLSFGAIGGLLLCRGLSVDSEKKGHTLREALLPSLCIQISLFPLQLYFYYEIPIYSPLLNLLVIPLMSVVLAAGLVGSALLAIGGTPLFFWLRFPGSCLLKICALLLELFKTLAEFSLRLPGARWIAGKPEFLQILFYYLLLAVALWIWRKAAKRRLAGILTGLFLILAIGCCVCGRGTGEQLEITMLDVGQGDGIVLRFPGEGVCLIDGGSSSVTSVGRYRLEPFLKSKGVSALDYVFVSHGDEDHLSGVQELLERQQYGVRIRRLVLPVREVWDEKLQALAEQAREAGVKVLEFQAGENLEFGAVSLRCLQPGEDSHLESGNPASMVLEISYGNFRGLFTGDLEEAGEQQLIRTLRERREKVSYNLLKVAHHGSQKSTTEEFLQELKPDYAWISAGHNNRYHHPHPKTLERLKNAGCQIFCTKSLGALYLETDGSRIRTSTGAK